MRHRWRMTTPPAVAELNLHGLCGAGERQVELQPLPVYPGIRRDMALVAPAGVTHADVERTIRENAPPELTAVTLFDIFINEGMATGATSLAYSLLYRSLERSLTDEEANGFHDSVKKTLQRELQVVFRDA